MTKEIQALRPENVEELSRFLARGFGVSAEKGPCSPDVLLWKYFDDRKSSFGPRSLVVREAEGIVGHVGLCPASFVIGQNQEVSTLHMIDWLGSPDHRGVGSSLLRYAHQLTPTQYGLGGSDAAKRVVDATRYDRLASVPVFQKVLRKGFRLRDSKTFSWKSLAQTARDFASTITAKGQNPTRRIQLRQVETFGQEITPIVDAFASSAIFTTRHFDILNHFLRHPAGSIEGSLILDGNTVIGFALLNVLDRHHAQVGKIVECFLADQNLDLWLASIVALTSRLRALGADVALGCGSTAWTSQAYLASGYREAFPLDFRLRDHKGLIPRDKPFHVTFLEADYAYLP